MTTPAVPAGPVGFGPYQMAGGKRWLAAGWPGAAG